MKTGWARGKRSQGNRCMPETGSLACEGTNSEVIIWTQGSAENGKQLHKQFEFILSSLKQSIFLLFVKQLFPNRVEGNL